MAGSAESITQAFAVSSLLVLLSVIMLIIKQVVETVSRNRLKVQAQQKEDKPCM